MDEKLRQVLPELTEPLLQLVRSSDEATNPPPRTSLANLDFLLTRMVSDETLPIDKTQRWLGFVQGVLAARGILDVDAERDRTREILHAVYAADGEPIPATVSAETTITISEHLNRDLERMAAEMKITKDALVSTILASFFSKSDSGW